MKTKFKDKYGDSRFYLFLKKIWHKINIRIESAKSNRHFLKNYILSGNNKKETLEYNMILCVHSLEKGISNKNPRPFGIKKIKNLIKYINNYEKNYTDQSFAYILSINYLKTYVDFYKKNDWTNCEEYNLVIAFLKSKNYDNIQILPTGYETIDKKEILSKATIDYDSFLSSRHSIRSFSNKELSLDDIEKAINMTKKTPSACNRQMCKIYYIKTPTLKEEVKKYGLGFGNFDLTNANFFIVTYDIAANNSIEERNQGMFNAGLFSMNFVNSLHSLGIGSCFIQFSNPFKEDRELIKKLNISKSERIAIIITAGYYEDKVRILSSARKSINDIYKVK